MMPTLEELDFFLMSNLSPRRTGLPFVVWVSPKAGAQHDVRVKVSMGPRIKPEELVSVTVRPPIAVIGGKQKLDPKHFELLQEWIKRNREALIQFWDGDIEYTEELLDRLKPI